MTSIRQDTATIRTVAPHLLLTAVALLACSGKDDAPSTAPQQASPAARENADQSKATDNGTRGATPAGTSTSSTQAGSQSAPRAGASSAGMGGASSKTAASTPEQDAGPAAVGGDVPTLPAAGEWAWWGHDVAQTRANPAETRIGPNNVSQLVMKWQWTEAAVSSTPVVRAGSVYFGDWQGNVDALDAKTGKQRWRVLAPMQKVNQITGSATLDGESLYIGGDNAMLYRLNSATGAIDWAVQVDKGGSSHTYASPAIVAGLALAGVASYQNITGVGADEPFRGSVNGVDVQDGAPKWKRVLTESTGVGVTGSAAIDAVHKRAYVGTGQNYEGDSPFADALVAVDYETGELAWHVQFTKGDIYSVSKLDGPDKDVLATPVLFSVDGREMVAAADKGGAIYVLDRSGQMLWTKQLTPGGHHGGVMGSMAYFDGRIYVCSGDFSTDATLGIGQDGPAQSRLFALDAAGGKELWSTPLVGLCYGALSYANGLVYLPAGDGNLRVYDATSGLLTWSQPLGQSAAGGVSIVDGMVYVSYGWDWLDTTVPGGVKAFGLP